MVSSTNKNLETFEDLLVWQKAMEVVKQIYLVSQDGKLNKDFALRNQLRSAALSIPTNIAEGFERASTKEYLNFLNIAKGSAGELRSLLQVAMEIGYLEASQHAGFRNNVLELSCYLANQIKSLRRTI